MTDQSNAHGSETAGLGRVMVSILDKGIYRLRLLGHFKCHKKLLQLVRYEAKP